jgi:hypothetical protein
MDEHLRPRDEGFTPAQRALREAARRLREAPGGPDVRGDGPQPETRAATSPDTAVASRPEVAGTSWRLLELDEVYVGSPQLGEVFAYWDVAGQILASVDILHTADSKVDALLARESTRHVDERWVVSVGEEPVFFVEQYRAAAGSSYGVFGPEGDPLGTFLAEGGVLHRDVVVREATSAPVATMRVRHHRHVITHASGVEVGYCWRAFAAVGNDDNDELWGLRLDAEADLLDRRALVAAPLVCHLMAFPKRHFDSGGEIGIVLLETVPPVGLVVVGVERALDGLYWLRRRLD